MTMWYNNNNNNNNNNIFPLNHLTGLLFLVLRAKSQELRLPLPRQGSGPGNLDHTQPAANPPKSPWRQNGRGKWHPYQETKEWRFQKTRDAFFFPNGKGYSFRKALFSRGAFVSFRGENMGEIIMWGKLCRGLYREIVSELMWEDYRSNPQSLGLSNGNR